MGGRSSFPRVSPGGALILFAHLFVLKRAFDASVYRRPLTSGALAASSAALLNGAVMAASLLNVLSHAGVVLGALNDAYVLSILVGVGFDVLTRMLQLVWWARLSEIAYRERQDSAMNIGRSDSALIDKYDTTIPFVTLLSAMYVYHMIAHVRALRMHRSRGRLAGVLRSALNNLRGVAGDGHADHFFAYTDLGGHLAPLWLSWRLLRQQRAVGMGCGVLALWAVASASMLARVPINAAEAEGARSSSSFVGSRGEAIDCSCEPCDRRRRRTGARAAVSFTFNSRDGVCRLWLYSFEELSDIVLDMPCRDKER